MLAKALDMSVSSAPPNLPLCFQLSQPSQLGSVLYSIITLAKMVLSRYLKKN